MKKVSTRLFAAFCITALLGGCSSGAGMPGEAQSTQQSAAQEAAPVGEDIELLISAAASLTDCLQELGALYQQNHPGITLTFNFGSSGALQQQIEQGAPADVFVSAGKKQMEALVEQSLMEEETVKDLLENKVVLITPKNGETLAGFENLADAAVEQIAVGEPGSVPVGQYTEEILESMGLSEQIAEKLVFAKDVREVLSWVETGNVQAGIVYETDAKISDKVTICTTAPEGSHKRVIYPAGVVRGSKNGKEAEAFVAFLFTEEAKAIFISYGFSPADEL